MLGLVAMSGEDTAMALSTTARAKTSEASILTAGRKIDRGNGYTETTAKRTNERTNEVQEKPQPYGQHPRGAGRPCFIMLPFLALSGPEARRNFSPSSRKSAGGTLDNQHQARVSQPPGSARGCWPLSPRDSCRGGREIHAWSRSGRGSAQHVVRRGGARLSWKQFKVVGAYPGRGQILARCHGVIQGQDGGSRPRGF
jgi:hypothetical protein